MDMETTKNKQGDLKVCWFPQVPCKAFEVPVVSVTEGVKLMDVLANYDAFQLENNIKPDYANTGELTIFEEDDNEFLNWYIEFDVTIKGQRYSEYFDNPEEFLNFLCEAELTEEEVMNAIAEQS